MEEMEEVRYDIAGLIRQYQNGLTSDEIWTKSKDFSDRTQLSRSLRLLTQLGIIFKAGDRYHHVDNTASVQAKETKAEPATSVKKEVVLTVPRGTITKSSPEPEVKKPVVNLPMGAIRRTQATGGAAYAFYVFRDQRPLTIDDLFRLTAAEKGSIYSGVNRLLDGGYIEKIELEGQRGLAYKWTGKFRYPFNEYRKEDKELNRYTPEEFFDPKYETGVKREVPPPDSMVPSNPNLVDISQIASQGQVKNTGTAIYSGQGCPNSSKMLEILLLLDQQIESHQTQIQRLERLKKTLSEPLAGCLNVA